MPLYHKTGFYERADTSKKHHLWSHSCNLSKEQDLEHLSRPAVRRELGSQRASSAPSGSSVGRLPSWASWPSCGSSLQSVHSVPSDGPAKLRADLEDPQSPALTLKISSVTPEALDPPRPQRRRQVRRKHPMREGTLGVKTLTNYQISHSGRDVLKLQIQRRPHDDDPDSCVTADSGISIPSVASFNEPIRGESMRLDRRPGAPDWWPSSGLKA